LALAIALGGCATTHPRATPVVTPAAPRPVMVDHDRAAPAPTEEPPVDPAAVAGAFEAAAKARGEALSAASDRAVGWWKLPDDLPYAKILDPDRVLKGSTSMGTVANGVLLNAAHLPADGPHYSIVERHRQYGTSYATREMIDLIRHASDAVAEELGGAPLRIGNMSRKHGGDIPWSHSHNAGRDADLCFYVLDARTKKSVPAPDLMRFDDDGKAIEHPEYVFDVARNWAPVTALLSYDAVTIQWIFVSDGLKAKLLDYARDHGADPKIVAEASEVLHQPTDAPPHDDHFHLRIARERQDRLEVCIDYGPKWEWGDWHRRALLARSLELARALKDADVDVRQAALDFLDQIKSPFAADVALTWGVWNDDADVRQRALDLAASQWSWNAPALVEAERYILADTTKPKDRYRAYSILRRSRDPLARDFAVVRLTDPAVPDAEKVYAARTLRHFMDPELVPFLIAQLDAQPAAVRVELAEVLDRVANRTEGIDWRRAPQRRRHEALASWRAWWKSHRDVERQRWLVEGFRRAGVDVDADDTLGLSDADALVDALPDAPDYVRYNANRELREITDHWAPLEQDDGRALFRYWEKWWKKNRQSLSESRRNTPRRSQG